MYEPWCVSVKLKALAWSGFLQLASDFYALRHAQPYQLVQFQLEHT